MGENQNGSGGSAQEFMLSYMKVRRSVSESLRNEQEDSAPIQEESVQDASNAEISGGEEGRSMNIDDDIELTSNSSKKNEPAKDAEHKEMSSDARAKAALASAFAMLDQKKAEKEEQAAREAAEAEAARRAAEEEEARKIAEQKAEEERRLAEIKAEEERKLAEQRAEEERRLAEQREREEEERRLEEERAEIARRFAEEQAEEEAKRRAEEEARAAAEAEALAEQEAAAEVEAPAEAEASAEAETPAETEAPAEAEADETTEVTENAEATETTEAAEAGTETTDVTSEGVAEENADQNTDSESLETTSETEGNEGTEETAETSFTEDDTTEELSFREEEDGTDELSYTENKDGELEFRSKRKNRLSVATDVDSAVTEGIHFLDNGNIIFGRFDQGNGPEPIEWIVLKQERGGKLFVISKNALEYMPYHELSRGVNWESCSLREWLNKGFIRTAFSENEQAHLIEYHVPADRNPECDTTVGPSTYDKVFLLSLKEAKKYLDSNEKRICNATPYARSHQANPDPVRTVAWWWLRTAGNFIYNAAGVAPDGSLYYRGRPVDDEDSAVRPAMWIKLK